MPEKYDAPVANAPPTTYPEKYGVPGATTGPYNAPPPYEDL